ncbi:MAG TPA: hypothetical protein VGG10_13595 [Rhizomicrobium sp.]
MLARVSRSENQTQDIYNRIESHLGGLGRRLEATERTTAENNQAMSKAATEINLAAREQAHAFDQLSSHMVSLSQRLERLEHSGSEGDGTKETIRTLHQGLSRLADQITQTAQQSATQIETLATSLEAVATKVAEVRTSTESASHTVEQRLAMLDERVRVAERVAQTGAEALEKALTKIEEGGHDEFEALASNLQTVAAKIMDVRTSTEGAARTMDQRLAMLDERVRVVERVSHSSADALDKALEHMEARQQARSEETAEIHRRVGSVEHLNDGLDRLTSRFASSEAQTAAAIARIEDSILRLDSRGSDPAIDRRLNSIERTLGDIVAKFEGASGSEEGLRKIHQRLDAVEQRHDELLDELQNSAPAHAEPAYDPAPQSVYAPEPQFESKPAFGIPPAFAQQSAFGQAAPAEPVFDAPPFPEAASAKPDPFADSFAPILNAPPFSSDATPASVFGEFAPQAAFPGHEATAPISEPPPPVTNESFLAAARRSARAAAAASDTEKPPTFSGFSWGPAKVAPAAAPMAASTFGTTEEQIGEEKPNYVRYLLIGIGVLIGLFAITAIFLSQRAGENQGAQHKGIGTLLSTTTQPVPTAPESAPVPYTQTAPNAAVVPSTPSPSATSPAPTSDSFSAVPPKTKAPRTAASATVPKKTVGETAPTATEAAAPKAAETPLDKLTKLANAGNAKAELLIGLKYIDADGVAANPFEGAKWLEKAAAKNEAVAAYRLGTLYERGKGVPADPTKATHWYQVAAQAGNRKAMHNLAVAYAQGTGTEKNFAEAARWFSKAAALGLSDSQFNLAVLYERGLGVPQSLLDAYKWYAIAAAQGDAESKARIDALSTQISADDKAAAQRSADLFKPQAIDRRANMTPEAGDVAR